MKILPANTDYTQLSHGDTQLFDDWNIAGVSYLS